MKNRLRHLVTIEMFIEVMRSIVVLLKENEKKKAQKTRRRRQKAMENEIK